MQEEPKITIVGAVYKTVVTSGDAFQRKIEQKQLEEKRVEQAVRRREALATSDNTPKPGKDVIDLSKRAASRVEAKPDTAPDPAPTSASTAPPPPTRGQAVNTLA